MATSPPASPVPSQRPMSAIAKPTPRSSSRLSMSGKLQSSSGANGSRVSDDDSRTAVKVAVRVRPPLKPEDPGYELIPQRFQRSILQTTTDTSLAIDSPQGRKLFVFDRVFSSDTMQDGIWEYLSESVDAFTQGYNVSLLAYGQSGAGKSYTMGTSGPHEQQNPELMGVVPRAATALFEKLDASKGAASGPSGSGIPSASKASNRNSMSHLRNPRGYGQQNVLGDKSWSLKATYVEIYNEQLRDLLVSDSTPPHERGTVAIREDTKGNIILTGLQQVEINSTEDLMNALNFGSAIRQTDSTAINAKSSRSHAVFSLNLVQRKAKQSGAEKRYSLPLEAMTSQDVSVTTDSKLHFVDLAGSERLKNTGAQGERAKEGISINAGLASLGKVISQLSSRQSGSHVSYRDSKLTRLLQDSLGGNAITYMIACVTPAEFHLSETLNTVQYAQRARAIQSKPRIQQVEEGDKQATIDRLKAEVAFLREQIRSSERGPSSPRRAPSGSNERSERQNEREAELQNQLLDVQENYNTLSQRHAKVISELARAREHESHETGDKDRNERPSVEGYDGETADDRINRSNSFAQAVEQVVMEYEKTIQSLEQSLSSTRGTLSSTEASLLEKETKCAYAETINTQLQARVQKLMDRETNTENYLHDLEAKLDGHTSGEEKNSTIITELRKEIARTRENEAACEDYISTIEERLAESDQDAELMQREIDRLEQVIERQRSLGKLDSLLYELDHVKEDKQAAPPQSEAAATNGHTSRRRSASAAHSRSQSHVSRPSRQEDPIPELDEDAAPGSSQISTVQEEATDEHDEHEMQPEPTEPATANDSEVETPEKLAAKENDTVDQDTPSPAQSRFVADKLENITQELFDLRVEHESTVNDYDTLHSKYEEAMRNISDLRDAVDEARQSRRNAREVNRDSVISEYSNAETHPESFLSDTRSSDLKDGPRSSLSRSLSSELSSAMDSPATMDTSNADDASADDDETATTKPAASTEDLTRAHSEQVEAELERFRVLAEEREVAEKELAERYAQLESKHNEALDMVEELKTEMTKARATEAATSPRRLSTPVIRRKSSQNLLVDRANRSFASLRNIAADNLESNPEVMQNFEINLNSAMHELHSRAERIHELEADVMAAKKEMESKMTIITGLTRERSSMQVNPMDMGMVATLRDQLEQSERQLMDMKQAHTAREQELAAELESLRKSLENSSSSESSKTAEHQDDAVHTQHEEKVAQLQTELANWESKHKTALDGMQNTEAEMRTTIQKLEAQVEEANAKLGDAQTRSAADSDDQVARESEVKQQNLISMLRGEIDEYKAIINSNAAKVAELEHAHLSTKTELESLTEAHAATAEESSTHKELVSRLEEQIAAHEQATKSHDEGLRVLKDNHARELTELKTNEQKGYEDQVEVLMTEHADSVQKLETELAEARQELNNVATHVAEVLGQEVSIEKLSERINILAADRKTLADSQKTAGEMEARVSELTSINQTMMSDLEHAKKAVADMMSENGDKVPSSIVDQLSTVKNRMSDLEDRSKKNSRLVEELEEQLQNNFDEAQVTNNRLSTLQSERNAHLDEVLVSRTKMQAELDTIREEYASLQAKYDEVAPNGDAKRSSTNSTVRKSASHASLPSPPPAIPLPPLPNGASSPPPSSSANGLPGSPGGTRPQSKDNLANISQVTEDQEARIRTIEKHLYAERQLTQTLEEALTDLEKQSNKVKADCDAWKKRSHELETEVKELKERPTPEPQQDNRWSLHAVEEERKKRQAAEAARRQLEERMNAINKGSKKKKGSLNCF